MLKEHGELAAFQQLREDLVMSLISETKVATGVEVSFLLMGDQYFAGINRQAIIDRADRVEILAYSNDPDQIGTAVDGVSADLDEMGKLVVGLQFYPPCTHSSAEMVACVEAATKRGISQFSYYNYGIAPRANSPWVGDCIKYCTGCSSEG